MQRITKKQREDAARQGNEAGEMISFFINGGNDTKWADRTSAEDGAIMALAHVQHLMSDDAFQGILKGLGLIQKRNAMGTMLIARGDNAFPKS